MTPNRLTGNSGSDEHFEQRSSSESLNQDEDDSTDYLLSLRDRQLRAFFEGAIDAMVIADDEGRYLDVNPAACELFGLTKQALLGRRITEFCEPGFDFTHIWQKFQQEARITGEFRLVQANGSVREVEYTATAHFLPHRHLSVMRDITDRKQMERDLYRLNRDLQQLNQELENRVAARTADLQQTNQQLEIEIRERQHSEARLRETQRISKVGGWAIDLTTRGEYWSEEIYHIHELPLDFGCPNVLNQTDFYINFYAPEARPIIRDAFQRAITCGEAYDLELPFITAKQHPRWVRTKATPIREQDKTVRVVGFLMDITDRKVAELALQKKTEELEIFFFSAIDLLCIADIEGHFLRLNPEWEKTLGYSLQALEGARFLDFVHPDDLPSTLDAIAQLSEQQPLLSFTNRYRHQDGSYRWIEWRSVPTGTLIYATARDITARKQAEEDLQQSEQRLSLALEAAEAGLWEWNMHTQQTYWSDRNFKLLGWEPGSCQPSYNLWLQSVHPDDRQATDWHVRRILEQRTDLNFSYRVLWPDGTIHWLSDLGKITYDDEGQPKGMIGIQIDITHLKQVEIQLRNSEEQLQLALEASGDGLWDWNIVTGELYLSPRWLSMLGYEAGELPGHISTWESLIHPDDRPQVTQILNAHLQDDRCAYKLDYRVRMKDGNWKWIVNYGKVVARDDQGHPLRLTGTHRDISNYKQAEAALRDSEERFRSAFDYAAIGKALVGLNGRFLKVNCALCEITGYSEQELLAMNFQAITHPDDLETDLSYAQQLFRGEIRSYQMEKRYFHKQGHLVWILLSGSMVRDANQEPLYFIAQVQDITVQKQIQAALQESEERYRSVVTAMAEGVVLQQADGRITAFNHSAEQILGLTADQILGRTSLDFDRHAIHEDGSLFPGDTHPAMVTLQTGQPQSNVVMGIHQPDRPTTWISINAQPLFHPHQTQPYAVVTSFADITPQKQVEETLRKREANLAAAQRVAQVGNWEFDIPTQKITWSAEMFRIFGLDPHQPEPTLSEHIQQIHPDDRAVWQETVQRGLLTGEPYIHEFRLIRPDRSVRVVEGRSEAVRDTNGQVIQLFGTTQDITERKQLEDSLRWQIQKQQTLSHLIQTVRQSLDLTVIFSTTAAAIGQFSNADRVEILQYHPDQKFWCNVADYRRTPEMLSALGVEIPDEGNPITARLKQLEIVRIGEADQAETPDNPLFAEPFPGSWLLVPLSRGTMVWGALSLVKSQPQATWSDAEVELLLTVTNQLAIAIQQSELYQQVQTMNLSLEQQVAARTAELQRAFYFETILHHIVDDVRDSLDEAQILQTAMQELALALKLNCCTIALYTPDRETAVIRYTYTTSGNSNQEICIQTNDFPELYHQLLQKQPAEFCHLPGTTNLIGSSSICPNLDQMSCFAQPIVGDQEVLGDLWLYKPGEEVFNPLERRLIQQVAIHCAIALRQSRLYQEIQSYAAELESLDQMKDEFLSTVTHELRSPMANIKMAVQMLEVALASQNLLTDRIQRYLQILKEECNRETSLINDLLDLSRLESGQIELNLTALDLKDWLPLVIQSFEERTQTQQQQLLCRLAPDLPPLITDTFHLQRILTELLHNACKYTPAHEQIIVSAETTSANPLLFKISVSNTGIEIPELERDRVFEKFYRIRSHDPWKYGGTGLGLALVKKLAACLGGSVQLETAIGQTIFTLQVPSQAESISQLS